MAALLFKETALALLLLIVALGASGSFHGKDNAIRREHLYRLVPYAACTAVYLALRSRALSGAGVQLEWVEGLGDRLMNNFYIVPKYAWTLLYPAVLSPVYTLPDDLHALALPLVLAWMCLIFVVGWLLTRGRTEATVFGLLWVFVFWTPVSGIVPIHISPLADRYLYIPAMGVWLVVADQFTRLLPESSRARWAGWAVMAILVLLMGAKTVRRNLDWKSDISLFSRSVVQEPDNAWAHAELGNVYYKKIGDDPGNLERAEQEFRTALSLDPSRQRLNTPMGSIRMSLGDYPAAIDHYSRALAAYPHEKEAMIFRAMSFEKLGRYQKAISDYRLFLTTPGRKLTEMRPYAEARVRALTR